MGPEGPDKGAPHPAPPLHPPHPPQGRFIGGPSAFKSILHPWSEFTLAEVPVSFCPEDAKVPRGRRTSLLLPSAIHHPHRGRQELREPLAQGSQNSPSPPLKGLSCHLPLLHSCTPKH